MILPIVYLNYLIFYWKLESLLYVIPFFAIFFGSIFWIVKKSKKIIPNRKNNTAYEIKYTITSFVIFFAIVFWYFKAYQNGMINFSFEFNIWSIVLGVLFVVFHDAYFYLVHRFLHTPFMMKYVHIVHHKSNPSNIWSSYSFHPIEALFYAWVSSIIFIFDVNIYALLFATFYNDFFTILGHCWYELFDQKIKESWFYKYFATTTYHDVHHSHNNGNIGLYFTYLDLIFKTKSKDSEKIFDKVCNYDK